MLPESENAKLEESSIIWRLEKAKALEPLLKGETTQADVAAELGVSQSTVSYWLNQRRQLSEKLDPKLVDFMESPAGIVFLHKTLSALLLVFTKMRPCGLATVQKFLQLTELDEFIACSAGTLQSHSVKMEKLITQFADEERERMGGRNALSFNVGRFRRNIPFWQYDHGCHGHCVKLYSY